MLRLRLFCIVLGTLLLSAGAAWGATLDVSPVRVHLSPAKKSESLELRNRSGEEVRYQVVAHRWEQTRDGEMKLTPTKDLVVFPSLLTLKPHEKKRLKVATTVFPRQQENAYRLVLEPLLDDGGSAGKVRVLTRVNLPVFVQIPKPAPMPRVRMHVGAGKLFVTVQNHGTSYFVARSLQIVARAGSGEVIFQNAEPGWYVLASGERAYSFPLPQGACDRIATITAAVKTEVGVARANLDEVCGR